MADLLNNPKFSLPFRVSNGRVVCIDQDSTENTVQSAVVVLRYVRGQRHALPEFGIDDLTFAEGKVDAAALTTRIRTWVPDATIDEITQAVDAATGTIDVNLPIGDSITGKNVSE